MHPLITDVTADCMMGCVNIFLANTTRRLGHTEIDYTGLQNRGGSVQKIRVLFSKVFRRAESKNGIRFGPTRHVFSQIEKILFGSEAQIGKIC